MLAVFDIDGVVADVRHRVHLLERHGSWHRFFTAAGRDTLLHEGARLVADLARDDRGQDVGLVLEQFAHARSSELVIVDHQDADRLGHRDLRFTFSPGPCSSATVRQTMADCA